MERWAYCYPSYSYRMLKHQIDPRQVQPRQIFIFPWGQDLHYFPPQMSLKNCHVSEELNITEDYIQLRSWITPRKFRIRVSDHTAAAG